MSETKVVTEQSGGLTASMVVEPSKQCAYLALYVDAAFPVVAITARRGDGPQIQVDMGDGTVKWIVLRKLVLHREACEVKEKPASPG